MHDAVLHEQIAARRHQIGIGIELAGHVTSRMVRIEDDHDALTRLDQSAHAVDRFRRDAVAFDEGDALHHGMRFDACAVVRTDLEIDADHPALTERLEQARIVDQRAPMGDAGFDDHVGLGRKNGFLDADHVVG